jgi:tape measure domain-containing protein
MADTNLNYKLNLKDFFTKGMRGAVDETKRLDGQMGKLNSSLKKVGIGIAAYFSAGAIKNFGSAVIESLKNYEYFSASLRTLMRGDRQTAEALEKRLVGLAATTPFSLVDVQQGSKQLLAYGFQAGSIVDNMKMLGDVSSGVGAPLNDIIYLYGTLRTQGRAYTKDIMQFTSRGIPIIGMLAKQFGVAETEVQKLVETGKVGFPQIEAAFRSMTSEGGQFFNMMSEQSKTVGGRLSNLADQWEQLRVNIGKSQRGIIASLTSFASGFVEKLNLIIGTANNMEAAFAKFGAKQYSASENFFNFLNAGGVAKQGLTKSLTGDKGRMEMFARSIQDMFVKPSEKDMVSALGSQAGLLRLRANMSKAFANKEIDKNEYQRSTALISAGLESVAGNIKLMKEKPSITNTDTTAAAGNSQAPVSSTEWSGARPQNITINVTKLVETLNIEAADVAGGVQEGAALTKKAFLELLNDANQMANR